MVRVIHERYRLVAPIGSGGMGAVFLADDLRLPGRQCALKEIVPVGPGSPEVMSRARQALRDEAAVLARLDHPGLPHVTDHFEADGNVFLVMDFIPGNDLKSILNDSISRGRQLDEAQVVGWALQLCDILHYLHSQEPPVIHRDLKPANVKLTPDGQVRLVDFGLAHRLPRADVVTVTVVAGGGSLAYQPLEQHGDSADVGIHTDIYALGASLYHLLAGRPPPPAQVRFLDSSRMAPLAEARPGVSPGVAAAVAGAMALHPDQRPASAQELRRLLLGPERIAPAEGRWSVALRRNAWLLALVVTLLLAAVAVTLAFP